MGTVNSIPNAAPGQTAAVVPDQVTADQRFIAHYVVEGDTVEGLAKRHGVSESTLFSENAELRQSGGKIYAGQLVYIPNVKSRSFYKVQAGDTVDSVAKKFNIDATDLRAANRRHFAAGLDDLLLEGDELAIPPPRPTRAPTPQPMGPISSTTAARPVGPQPMEPQSTNTNGFGLRPAPANPLQRTNPPVAPPGPATGAPGVAAAPPIAPVPGPAPLTSQSAALPPAIAQAQPSPQAAQAVPQIAPAEPDVPMPASPPLDTAGLTAASFGSRSNPYTSRVLQRMLNRTGANLTVDGAIGSGSRGAIRDFQKSQGLLGQKGVRPGVIDSATLAALKSASETPAPLSKVDVKVTARDMEEPDVRAAYNLVSALAHDDPQRFRSLLQMDRAQAKDGALIIDRATLQAIASHVQARGFRLKSDPNWSYDEAQSVANLIGNTLNVDRVFQNRTYDALIASAVPDEIKKWMHNHPGYKLRSDLDMAAWVKSSLCIESSFDRLCVSGAGAQGPAQAMPAAQRELGLKNPFNYEESIRFMVRFALSVLPNYADRNVAEVPALVASAYNAGPNGQARYNIADNTETRNHARMVNALYNVYSATGEPRANVPMPSPAALGLSQPRAAKAHHDGRSRPAHHKRRA